MNRRNFFRSMIGGVAAAAAVRTFPFRVFSFPTDLRILNPVVGQTLYTTAAGGNNYIQVGDVMALELENIAHEIPDLMRGDAALYKMLKTRDIEAFSSKGESRGRFRVTGVDAPEKTITIEPIPGPAVKWAAVDPACEEDSESARTINKLMDMGLLR